MSNNEPAVIRTHLTAYSPATDGGLAQVHIKKQSSGDPLRIRVTYNRSPDAPEATTRLTVAPNDRLVLAGLFRWLADRLDEEQS